MSEKSNKYGLSRGIPDTVKRQVRQRCGFGCVRCGFAIYHYHHFDPPFEEAEEHNPDGITLLCGGCHDHVGRGLLSFGTISAHNRNPKCLQRGFSHDVFDVGNQHPIVILGYSTWVNTRVILEAFGLPLLEIESPETTGTPFRLSGVFYDQAGKQIFRIVRNEWQGPITNWDIETEGRRVTIRRAPRQIALQIRSDPPSSLTIERLDMLYKGARIIGEEGKRITVIASDGSTIQGTSISDVRLDRPGIHLGYVTGVGCEAGIVVLENGVVFGRKCQFIGG